MGALKEYVLEAGRGPLIGLFGDHWQTIYRKDYELIDFPGVTGIDKGSNFRSTPAIVDVLNRLRPELRQEVDNPAGQGEARFFHCNGFEGQRVSTTHARGELPPEQHALALQRVMDLLVDEGWHFGAETTKVLMLTHNAIAAGRGYPTIAKIFDHKEAFAKKEDAAIAFLADVVEPACAAYAAARYGAMFQTMGGIPTIRRAADKIQWRADMDALLQLRQNATIGEVIDHLKATRRPRLSDQVQRREDEIAQLGLDPAEDESKSLKRHRALRAVPYRELISVAEFINGFTPFATQHSVKGAEFDNVLVVLSGGWNQYNWPKLLENLTTNAVPARELEGYYRARNLLYVALSRPKKRLAVLATQQLSARALEHAAQLFTEAHVVALPWD
jgi:DNA helicase-2/ATP-dependent DNA helicase PcrA